MQTKLKYVVPSLLVFLFSFPVHSKDLNSVFEDLRNTSEKYEIKGTVCEQVARLELEQQYPSNEYTVENNIAYSQHGQVLGELDVVVFRKYDARVILIGEVKCWHNVGESLQKAVAQREKFRKYLRNGGHGIDFYKTTGPVVHFNPSQFRDIPPYILIAQQEGNEVGFDLALPYTLRELMELRDLLVRCQMIGECPAADR
jgi:hypothetical protein